MGFMSGITGGIGSGIDDIMEMIPGYSTEVGAQSGYTSAVQAIIDKINSQWSIPEYDQTPLTPQEYQVLNTYAPQIAGFVQQQQPQLIPNTNNQGTQAQQQALNQLGVLSGTGVDTGTQAQFEEAQMKADQALRANRANALNQLAQRGLLSSGATLNADIGAGIAASEQQRQASVQAAADAAQRRMQAIQGLGNLGSQVAGQKQGQEEFNANTLNQYNQLLSNRQQQYQDYVANTGNQANMYNQQLAQNISNMNAGTQNQYGMYNQQRADQIQNNLAQAKNQKLQTLAELEGGLAKTNAQFGMQRGQDETHLFAAGVGMLPAALSGGSMGGAPAGGAGSSYLASSMNPNYSFNGYGQQGGYSQEGALQ